VESTTAGVLIEEADYFLPIVKEDCFTLPMGQPKKKTRK
jgi:hypothetical protein